jgi:quinoprotein glucose dehydrogenase
MRRRRDVLALLAAPVALALGACVALALGACERPAPPDFSGPTAEWREYGGDKGGRHWSALSQITRENVGELELAWEYRHGDRSDASDGTTRTSFNATPLVVDGAMYFCTG